MEANKKNMMLDNQSHVSPKRGMPVDNTDYSQKISSVSGETVQLKFISSGTLTNDSGEAAGTAVIGKLDYGTILDEVGSQLASYGNSSLSFTSTALTTEVELDPTALEAKDGYTLEQKISELTENLSNGEYYVDYRYGVIIGKKDDTSTSLTSASYIISSSASSVDINASDINIGNINLLNTSGTEINPATEDKQDVIIANQVKGVWDQYEGVSTLVTASDIGVTNDTWVDQGTEIDMRGYKKLGIWITFTVNDSTGNELQVLSKHTSGGTDEYVVETSGDYQKTIGDSSIKILYEFNTDGKIPYLQLQTKAAVVGTTPGVLDIELTKSY